MNDDIETQAQEALTAVLEGGPSSLPEALRRQPAPSGDDRIKVPHLGGYEHFERAGSVDGDAQVVYRWTTRTRVAE
ncbi:MAG TPA: DUF5988 family protein [Dactylosporangium sp.]|nr:DUF5988 family protein [Dactylosporangium sp.]